jgi:hypothetical protein
MTVVKDSRQHDEHKFFAVNRDPENLIDLELEWIHGISDQVEFANTQVLTQYDLKLKIAKKWRSWDKVESAI